MTGEQYWNMRGRGFGGEPDGENTTSRAEENLLGYPGTRYFGSSICVHEFSHGIMRGAIYTVDPDYRRAVEDAYAAAKKQGLFSAQGTPATTSTSIGPPASRPTCSAAAGAPILCWPPTRGSTSWSGRSSRGRRCPATCTWDARDKRHRDNRGGPRRCPRRRYPMTRRREWTGGAPAISSSCRPPGSSTAGRRARHHAWSRRRGCPESRGKGPAWSGGSSACRPART
jgi:hypothetical protein